MKLKYLIAICAMLCVAPFTLSAANLEYNGDVSLGGRIVDVDNEDSAKYEEYRDLDDGVIGSGSLNLHKRDYYLHLDVGKTTNDAEIRGGRFGKFKYSLYYDELEHNLSYDARTFYSGVDSNMLTATIDENSPGLWAGFDYDIEHKTFGFDTEVSFNTPFYIEIGGSQRDSDGLTPFAGSSTTANFGSMIELPAPVDWETKNAYLGAGYRTKELVFSVRGEISEFDNSDEELYWDDVFTGITDVSGLAPDNDYYKVSAQLVWRIKEGSSLVVRSSYALLESDTNVRTSIPDVGGPNIITTNRSSFDGEISYTTFDIAYKMEPIESVDLKFYYKYLDRANDSPVVTFTDGVTTDTTNLYEYDKNIVGFDGSWRLPMATTLDFGYEYTNLDRSKRLDTDETEDNLVFLQLRNRSRHNLELRAKYEYLDRSSDFLNGSAGTDLTDDASIQRFVRRFDATDQERNRVELEASVYLNDNLGLSLEYAWQDSEYDETELGLTDVEHQEIYLSGSYSMPDVFAVTAYAGFENDQTDMDSRAFDPGQNTDPSSGSDPSGGTPYNWTETKEFDTYALGLMVEAPIIKDRLMLTATTNWQEVDGEADFSTPYATLIDFDEVEDYTKTDFEAKLAYTVNESLELTLGYLYEDYEFDDEQWDGYNNAVLTSGFDQSYLTGAYADSDYEVNVVYLLATYRF